MPAAPFPPDLRKEVFPMIEILLEILEEEFPGFPDPRQY